MSQILFPNSPSPGDFIVAPNGVTYTYDEPFGPGIEGVWFATAADPLAITNPGTITGTAEVNATVTYSGLTTTGGVSPVVPTWVWKISPGGATIAGSTDQPSITVPSAALGKQIYVEVTVNDAASGSVTAVTGNFPASPNVILPAGITGAQAPITIPGTASFTWADPPGTLTASGCIEFSIDAGANWVTSASVTNAPATTVLTRWVNTPSSGTCGDSPGNATISGTLTSSNGETTTFTFAMDRTPNAFSLVPNIQTTTPNTVTTANPTFTLAGTDSPSFIWGSLAGGGGTPQYSVDGGTTWANIPTSPGAATVNPNATVKIKFTTGSSAGTNTFTVNVGASTTPAEFQSGAFTVTVAAAPFPNLPATLVAGPTQIPQVVSATWADGPVPNLTSTGCIQISLDGSTWGQGPLNVTNTSTLYMQWDPTGPACGGAASGTPISGTITNGVYTNSYNLVLDRDPTVTPNPVTPITGQALSTTATSSNVILSASNAPSYLTYTATTPSAGVEPLANPFVSINSGAFTAVPTSGTSLPVPPGATLQFQGDVAGANGTAYTTTFNLGTTTLPWSVTTTTATPTITPPNIVTPGTNATGVGTASGITITADPYANLNGAGSPQTSSTWEVYKNGFPLTSTNTISGVTQTTAAWTRATSNGITNSTVNSIIFDGAQWWLCTEFGGNWTTTTPGGTWSLYKGLSQGTSILCVSAGLRAVYARTSGFAGTGGIVALCEDTNNTFSTFTWSSAAFTAGVAASMTTWVVVAGNGQVAYGPLGFGAVPLTTLPSIAPGGLSAITYGGGQFVTGGGGGGIYTSPDGITWTARTSNVTGSIMQILYVNGKYYAWTTTQVTTSTDGITWTSTTLSIPAGVSFYIPISYGNGLFLATGSAGVTSTFTSSTDGINWSTTGFNSFGGLSIGGSALAYGAGTWVAGAINGGSGTNTAFSTNPAGSSSLTIANCQNEGFLVGDTVISGSGAAAGPATITSLDNTQVTVAPSSTSWVGTNTQTLKSDPASYGQITGSPFTKTTGTLTSLDIAKPPLETNTKYWVRAQYATTNITATTSAFGGWSDFTTGGLVPTVGALYGGGYFAGQINDGGTIYNLVVAPVEGDPTGPAVGGALKGQYGGTIAAGIAWKNSATAETGGNIVLAQSLTNGKPWTVQAGTSGNYAAGTYPLFQWCIGDAAGPNAGASSGGTGIGGYNDWYIPSKYEMEVCYYFLKPNASSGVDTNSTSSGANPNAVSPEPVNTNYTTSSPGQTSAALFQGSNTQAWPILAFWNSSENSSNPVKAWQQSFQTGQENGLIDKYFLYYARSVRRVAA